MAALNPAQFPPDGADWEDEPPSRPGYFHGSKVPLEKGETIVPGYTMGKGNYDYEGWPEREDGTGQHEHVYTSADEGDAHSWASGGDPEHGQRRYTYDVDPGPFVEHDTDTHDIDHETQHYVSPDAVINDRIDIRKPSSYSSPVQGTLAPYDWNKTVVDRLGRTSKGEGLTYVNDPNLRHEGGNPAAEDWAKTVKFHDVRDRAKADGSRSYAAPRPEPKPERTPEIPGQLGMQFR